MLARLEFTHEKHRYRAAVVDDVWQVRVDAEAAVAAFPACETDAANIEELQARIVASIERNRPGVMSRESPNP